MMTKAELLAFMREEAYRPMTYREMEEYFELPDAEAFKNFLIMLNELEEEGEIVRTRTDRYGVPERMNLIRGKLQAHPKGFGFLIPDDPSHADIYIHANDLQGAMNGDTIMVRILTKGAGNRFEGEVARIVDRANKEIVGEFQPHEGFGFVIPDDKRMNKDIFVPEHGFANAVAGQKVVVEIVKYPEGRAAAEGRITEILGHKNDPGVDILSVIRKYQLPEDFSEPVMAEAMQVPDEVQPHELEGRQDLRHLPFITIDGADAKDLDDAVHIEQLENGHYLLRVSIADVGYYVKEGSHLDREAYRRGCSVYLVDRVIPMLPPRLSNGICSLHPNVDRLTLTCEMEFDRKAKLVRHDIYPSVLQSVQRVTYENIRKLLVEEDEDVKLELGEHTDRIYMMQELALKLRGARMGRGAIDFDFPESKILVDEDGKPTDIIKLERSIAEQIIEEFMLAANETVAEHFYWMRVPFLYRIHEDPDSEKLMSFLEFITNFGYVVKGTANQIHPRALQTLLNEIKGTKEETVISTVLLRSMKQAKYEAESRGHFGLSAEFYTHFTAPIRRYPDLVIHRIIREVISSGRLKDRRSEQLEDKLPDIARQSSERERIAVDAERETDDLKKAQYMLDKVGEEYEGIVSGVTSFGMFVELDNTVEGLIRLSDLHDDYYHYHDRQHALIGERTAKVYRIGDEVKVRVVRVNMEEYTIDFEMLETKARKPNPNAKSKSKPNRKSNRNQNPKSSANANSKSSTKGKKKPKGKRSRARTR